MSWAEINALMIETRDKALALPKSTGGKTNLSASFPSGVNLYSAAITLPERRHYLAPHSTQYGRMSDIQTLQSAAQLPDFGGGTAISNGAVIFPDGEIMLVPGNATSITIFQSTTETSRTLTSAPGNFAYLGGALWDDETAIFAPHLQNYALLVNKTTGVKRELTGYNFGANYACAGVRKCSTGEFYFVPHNHNKHVFLDPVTETFRVLSINAPGLEAYLDCTNLYTGEIYVQCHKAACSVVIDPVTGDVLDTLPPVGAGVVTLTPNWANFRTCRYLPDGDVMSIPFKHTKAWRYNRTTNRHTQTPGTYTSGAVGCSSLTEFGDVMEWPWNGGAAYRLSTGYGFIVDPRLVTSPYINGF
jgi:hypothetical protein